MRNLMLIAVFFISVQIVSARSQVDTLKKDSVKILQAIPEFMENLNDGMSDLDSAKSAIQVIAASNHLCLIAKKYDSLWVTNYYASMGRILCSYVEKDEKGKDAFLDEAETFLNRASLLYKMESDEIDVMFANLAGARLTVNPMSRYKKYGDLFNDYINKAKVLNPNNPRIYFLQGTSVFHTPKMFGGGAKNALPLFEKAAGFYQNEKGGDLLKPYWGRKKNESYIQQCNEQISKP